LSARLTVFVGMGASTLLGNDHPLTRAESLVRTLRAQLAVTVVFGLLIAALSPLLGRPALNLALGAAAVSGLLVAAVLIARSRVRGRAFELIAGGREELPLRVVASERSRLLDQRTRRRLARTLDVITVQPTSREWWSPVYADHAAVRGAENELREIAALLRERRAIRARGVALVTALICEGATSPLYRGPAPALREELGRIRHVLHQPL
jgi:hypothetical protein